MSPDNVALEYDPFAYGDMPFICQRNMDRLDFLTKRFRHWCDRLAECRGHLVECESGYLSALQKQLKGMIKAGVAPVKWDKSGFSFSLQEKEDRAIPFPSELDDDLSISLDPALFKKCLPESGDVLLSYSNPHSPLVIESNELGKALFMPMSLR